MNNEIGKRIKHLRKDLLKMTQEDFASSIKLKRAVISHMENGIVETTDRNIQEICDVHMVSEKWLRRGIGDVFVKFDDKDFLMGKWGDLLSPKGDDFERLIISLMLQLDEESWKRIKKALIQIFDAMKDAGEI